MEVRVFSWAPFVAPYNGAPHGKPDVVKFNTMAFSVYILELQDGSYYVGFSENLERRLQEHQKRIACSHTKKIPMKQLMWSESQPDRVSARKREKEIKAWRREKKERLWNDADSSLS